MIRWTYMAPNISTRTEPASPILAPTRTKLQPKPTIIEFIFTQGYLFSEVLTKSLGRELQHSLCACMRVIE